VKLKIRKTKFASNSVMLCFGRTWCVLSVDIVGTKSTFGSTSIHIQR